LTDAIENYPGYDHIGGLDLMTKFEGQSKALGTEFLYEEVVGITENEPGCFTVKTTNNEHIGCALILSFGKTPRDLGVPGEQELKGKGVSYCAVCDGPLFKQKKVAVVGAGDPALEAATLLKGLASEVNIIHRTDSPIGSEEAIQILRNDCRVKFVPHSVVKRVSGSSKVESLIIEDLATKTESSLSTDGIFVEAGYIAKTDFLKDFVELNGNKEVVVNQACETNHPGVFAAGDVTNVPFKQAIISAGQGATAALSAYNYLQKMRGRPALKSDWKSDKSKTISK